MGIIYTFWFLSIVLALLSYWFRTERITILGSLSDFRSEYGRDLKTFNDLREKYPRKIFLFVGKPDNSYISLKDEGDLHLDAEKSIEKLMEEMIKSQNGKHDFVCYFDIENFWMTNKSDLEKAKKIIYNLRISKFFESGIVFLTTLYGVLDDKEGISFDEFKKEYKI